MATEEKYFAARRFPRTYVEYDPNGSILKLMLEKMSRDLADKALVELEKGERIFNLSSVTENNNMPEEIEYRQYLTITELVRCKDCCHCYSEGFVHERNVCEKHPELGNVPDDWFCGDGEKEKR